MSGTGSRHKAPEDGIVTSNRQRGWPATRWMAGFDHLSQSHHSQLARGRTLARSGRVRDLWFSPGLGSAEVITNKNAHRVSVRVRVFDDDEWASLVAVLLIRLDHIAAMLEGELPEAFVSELETVGLSLLPSLTDVDGVCDCGDFRMPCSHMAAVHNVIADALDGDPFLMLTLRGLNRQQLLARLRKAWNDPRPMRSPTAEGEEVPPTRPQWDQSPRPLDRMRLAVSLLADARPGVRALGPPPGQTDLVPALQPLYDAGCAAAYELAMKDPAEEEVAARSLWRGFEAGQTPSATYDPTVSALVETDVVDAPEASTADMAITERLVDLLAEMGSAKSKELGIQLGVPALVVRQELIVLEQLGIVYRTGHTRGTRWWLG